MRRRLIRQACHGLCAQLPLCPSLRVLEILLLFPPKQQMRKEGLTTSLWQLGGFLWKSDWSVLSQKGRYTGFLQWVCWALHMHLLQSSAGRVLQLMKIPAAFFTFPRLFISAYRNPWSSFLTFLFPRSILFFNYVHLKIDWYPRGSPMQVDGTRE